MVATILLTVSVVAFGQFALHYWRAMIAGVASQEISETILVAARLSSPRVGPADFRNILIVKDLSPDLRGSRSSFMMIRAYYSSVKTLSRLIPSVGEWAQSEMATCSRYVAVIMGQQLDRNVQCAAQMRGV